MSEGEYPDVDTSRYHEDTEFRATTCDAPSCEEPLTTVVPSNGMPYVPKEHIRHTFPADYQGVFTEGEAHFCSPQCFIEYVESGFSMEGTDFVDMVYCGDFDSEVNVDGE